MRDFEILVGLAKKYGIDEADVDLAEAAVKRKKKHWTQLPGAKAKLAKAHRKAKKTREGE